VIRNILVPVDGSTFGEHALPLACTLARKAGAPLHLVHVHQTVPLATIGGVAVMDSIDLHLRQDEQAYLADLTRRVQESGPIQVRSALADGAVAEALKSYASQFEVDLVVMSTHGRGAMGRFWLGSVADELVRVLPRPVLLVGPHQGKPDLHHTIEFQEILLPLDGTLHAEKILEPASKFARLFGSHLTLLRVIKPVLRPTYLPEGTSGDVLSYWYQRAGGPIFNDCICVGAQAAKPVIAHRFLNYLLEPGPALKNFVGYVGYQPPLNKIDAQALFDQQLLPAGLENCVVTREDYANANAYLALTAGGRRRWDQAWAAFRNG